MEPYQRRSLKSQDIRLPDGKIIQRTVSRIELHRGGSAGHVTLAHGDCAVTKLAGETCWRLLYPAL